HQEVERNERDLSRQNQECRREREEDAAPHEANARERVAGGRGEENLDRHGNAGDDDRVEEESPHRPAREEIVVVLDRERTSKPVLGRDGQIASLAQRYARHVEERRERKERERAENRVEPELPATSTATAHAASASRAGRPDTAAVLGAVPGSAP